VFLIGFVFVAAFIGKLLESLKLCHGEQTLVDEIMDKELKKSSELIDVGSLGRPGPSITATLPQQQRDLPSMSMSMSMSGPPQSPAAAELQPPANSSSLGSGMFPAGTEEEDAAEASGSHTNADTNADFSES